MKKLEERQKALRAMTDKSRKAVYDGGAIVVPHKFTEAGEVVTGENFDPKRDLSRLTLDHWRLLEEMQKNGWDLGKACASAGLGLEKAKSLYKRIRYFRFEGAKEKALAATLSPEFVLAKHMENVYTNQLEDGQRDSLKEIAKIRGDYKTAAQVNIHQNVFNMPAMTPEVEAKFKALAEEALEAEIVVEKAANG